MRPPTASELVNAAMRGLGVSNQTDLTYELRVRYGLRVSQSQVSRWLTERNEPEYETTLALLDAAGWLNTEQDPGTGGDLATEIVRRLEAGERFDPDRLLELAEEMNLAAQAAARLAARLQRAARRAESNG